MTVDPSTPEGRRRTRRGLLLGAAALVSLAAQGLPLVAALRDPVDPTWWLVWGGVLIVLVACFALEARAESHRRASKGKQ